MLIFSPLPMHIVALLCSAKIVKSTKKITHGCCKKLHATVIKKLHVTVAKKLHLTVAKNYLRLSQKITRGRCNYTLHSCHSVSDKFVITFIYSFF